LAVILLYDVNKKKVHVLFKKKLCTAVKNEILLLSAIGEELF
jgi:hypothetical protein